MERSPEMQRFVDGFFKQGTGRSLSESQTKGVCSFCGNAITGFKDALSEKEHRISGFCQECQDKTFVDFDEDE